MNSDWRPATPNCKTAGKSGAPGCAQDKGENSLGGEKAPSAHSGESAVTGAFRANLVENDQSCTAAAAAAAAESLQSPNV